MSENGFMKKFFILLAICFIIIFTFIEQACAGQLYKFTDANFDTSNSIIVLSGQDTVSGNVPDNIKLVKMQNPSRVYFDIDSSIITFPKQEWNFNTDGIKQIKINHISYA